MQTSYLGMNSSKKISIKDQRNLSLSMIFKLFVESVSVSVRVEILFSSFSCKPNDFPHMRPKIKESLHLTTNGVQFFPLKNVVISLPYHTIINGSMM